MADTDYQLSIIDSLADNADERALYSVAYAAYRRALKAYTDMRELLRRSAADAQYLQFQLSQLDEMKLQHGEQEQLERDRELLANATAIKQHLRSALGPMAEDNINAIGVLAEAAMHCRALGDMIEDGESLAARIDSARIEIQDIAESLSDLDSNVQVNPAMLDDVEERLGALYSLELKHHVDTVDELINLRESLRSKLAAIEGGEDSLSELEMKARMAKEGSHDACTCLE